MANAGSAPARLICGNDLPFLLNVFRNEHLLFDHPYAFSARLGAAARFAGTGEFLLVAPGRHLWETSFVPDLATLALPEWEARGAGNRNVNVVLSDSSMHAHVSEMPAGTYTKGRRHDAGVHVLGISGAGYTLVWKEGEGNFERLELRPGSLFALTDETLHQHFNPGAEPLRYLALSVGSDRYPLLARKLKRRAVFDASMQDGGLRSIMATKTRASMPSGTRRSPRPAPPRAWKHRRSQSMSQSSRLLVDPYLDWVEAEALPVYEDFVRTEALG